MKVVTAFEGNFTGRAVAKCPRGYVVIGGGMDTGGASQVTRSLKQDQRRWVVNAIESDPGKRGGASAGAMAICAKGTGGFQVTDAGEVD